MRSEPAGFSGHRAGPVATHDIIRAAFDARRSHGLRDHSSMPGADRDEVAKRTAKNARNPALAGFLPDALGEVSAPPCFTGGAIP